jgi:glycosyltransferase involved in cell wall biosynthesis
MRVLGSTAPTAPPVLLTLQLLCLGDARGLQVTMASLEEAAAGLPWGVEIQLVPCALTPAGWRELVVAAAMGPRVSWWQGLASGPAAALNAATRAARGLWIWWLEPGDRLTPMALRQWHALVSQEPRALVIAADGEHLDQRERVRHRHGVLPVHQPLQQLVDANLYCPGAVSWRRCLELHLPPLAEHLEFCYREAWLLTALEQQRQRWVTLEALWVQTHRNSDWQQLGRCRGRALEWARELQRRWGEAPMMPVQAYALELAHGEAGLTTASSALVELEGVLHTVQPLLSGAASQLLQRFWGLDRARRPWQELVDGALRTGGLLELWCVELLRNLLYPELQVLDSQAVWGPRRLVEQLLSEAWWSRYSLLRQDKQLINLLNQPLAGLPLIALLRWLHEPELQERYPLPEHLDAYGVWWREQASAEMPHIRFDAAGCIVPEPLSGEGGLRPEHRPFGVNLIGHAFEVFGVGEDVRMAALALESAAIPFCVVNVPAGNGAAASDRSLEAHVLKPGEVGPYRFNLVCMAAPSHGAWIAREGLAQQQGRITIVAWPWETQTWPRAWECLIPLADVFWPASTFTAKALEPFSDPQRRPLQVMPMAVHIDQPEQYRTAERRRRTRERWGLDPDAVLVLFVFDVKSSLARKNPWGAIQAFQRAFPCDGHANVQLVIKALRPEGINQAWEQLQQQAAHDSRLKVIEGELNRDELLALMGACDVFLSLHRSEGFGRGIAEAGMLGLQVVTSTWGGNVDFCKGNQFHMVSCLPAVIAEGSYVQAEGHMWGDPDLTYAALLLLKSVFPDEGEVIRTQFIAELTPGAIGHKHRDAFDALNDKFDRR